jgi:hypothetical protein
MKRLDADLAAGRLTGVSDLHDRVIEASLEDPPLALARHPHRIGRLMKTTIAHVVPPSVTLLSEGALDRAEQRLTDEKEERAAFETRLKERWGGALNLLTLFRLWCLEACITFEDRHAPTEGDWVHAALIRLHARACLITAEVLTLLRSGFASGAHARWRSAHEIAVVGYFIAKHGHNTAERYLLHETVEDARAAVGYQRHAVRLGYEPFTASDLATLEADKEAVVARFGKAYGKPYGWASNVLDNPDPKFGDLEADVSLDHLRPYYRMASYPTHAGPKGIAFDLGQLDSDLMLAGPSSAGLSDPGHSVAISLLQITVTLLSRNPDIGDLVTMTFLQEACRAVGDAFISAHRQFDEDNEQRAAD